MAKLSDLSGNFHPETILQLAKNYPVNLGTEVDPKDGDYVLNELAVAVETTRDHVLSAIDKAAAVRKNAMQSPMKNESQVEKMLDLHGQRVLPLLDAARQSARQELDKMIGSTLPKATKDQAEIRQALREMRPDDRTAALDQAIADRDEAVIGAACASNPFTSGIRKEQQDLLRQRWQHQAHPETSKRVERTRLALDQFDKTCESYMTWSQGFVDRKKLNAALDSERSAQEALAD